MKEIDKKSATELFSDEKSAPTKMKSLQDQIDYELAQALSIIEDTENVEQLNHESVVDVDSEFLDLTPQETEVILSNLLRADAETIESVHALASMIEETLDLIDQKVETPEISEQAEYLEHYQEEVGHHQNVVAFAPATKFVSQEEPNLIKLEMTGQTEMKLMIGSYQAVINLHSTNGVELSLADIKIVINEKEGCHIESKNGINLTIPLSIDILEHKKKAA